jgi:dTDP-4-amino-4,6-dideoxygalactose transaminase
MTADQLATLGGPPVRTRPFPIWPPASEEAAQAVADAVRSGTWSDADGPLKQSFERDFAAFHGARYGVGVSNGTVALEVALAALGIGSGDEVIVPSYTFLATATAVLAVNALPVFVDVDPTYGCLDPHAVRAAITSRTRAMIAVHLGGHPADVDELVPLAETHGIALVEDCAHAHGATWNDRGVGSFGAFGTWSFQASKNMTAGEGGILVTSDEELAETAWSIHHCGRSRTGQWYEHGILGGNYRLTELQAAVLLLQLKNLADETSRRNQGAATLDTLLHGVDGLEPVGRDARCTSHGFHLYQLWYDAEAFDGLSRRGFVEAMRAEGIPASTGYGVPLDRQGVFADLRFDRIATGYDPDYPPTRYGTLDLPNTWRFCREAVWLPQYVLLADDHDLADVATAAAKVKASAALASGSS